MKKIHIFAICLGVVFPYLETAESMKKRTTRTSQKNEVSTSGESQIELNLGNPANPSELADWMEENLGAILENELTRRLLEAYIREIITTNLACIPPEYINNAIQVLSGIIKNMSKKDERFSSLKKLINHLREILRLRKSISRPLDAVEEKLAHPFLDKKDPLIKGILYAFQYVNIKKIEYIAKILLKIPPYITDKANKREIKQFLQDLSDLLEEMESMTALVDTLEKDLEVDTDILDQKFPQLPNLTKAANSQR
ncbi:MAG: hypothetical protein LBF54_02015 [Holosporaceae bacterium]|nr:hypothetical protein [Holosporaceae bacterium]